MTTAELSRFLFTPTTLVLYLAATVLYLRAMVAPAIDSVDQRYDGSGSRARTWATVLAVAGVTAHVAHMVLRTVASGRLPLGNMFEFSGVVALTVVLGGLVVVQWRMRRPELMGFVLLGAVLTLLVSLLLYSDPAPLQPVLNTWWRAIHVSAIVFAAGVFTLAAVFNALQLLRDTAEARVAERGGAFGPGTVGAARAATDEARDDVDDAIGTTPRRIAGPDDDSPRVDLDETAYRRALRASLTEVVAGVRGPWRLTAGVALVTLLFSLIWWDVGTTATMVATMAVLTIASWWLVPFLPTAADLDRLTYRTITFAFPIWTFAVIAGAMWAEQSWGRFWGWDPKETSSFVLWVAYAGYLHARATRGLSRRTASWLGLASYGVFLFTYYAVNLLFVGLHSYGGIDPTIGG